LNAADNIKKFMIFYSVVVQNINFLCLCHFSRFSRLSN